MPTIKRSSFKFFLAIFLSLLAISASVVFYGCRQNQHEKQQTQDKPNIIFILADDMGYGDLRAYNPLSEICSVRGHGLHLFGDIVNTFNSCFDLR